MSAHKKKREQGSFITSKGWDTRRGRNSRCLHTGASVHKRALELVRAGTRVAEGAYDVCTQKEA